MAFVKFSTPRRSNASFIGGFALAGGLGFEPRLTESESAVLPLNYPPVRACRRISVGSAGPGLAPVFLSAAAPPGPSLAVGSGFAPYIGPSQTRVHPASRTVPLLLRARCGRSDERHEIVFAHPLQHEEHGGAVARVGDEVRPRGPHRVGLARLELHVLLGLAHENPDVSGQHIECVLDVAVAVPRHLLLRADLQLGNAEAGPLGMNCAALHFVEPARILDRLHVCSSFKNIIHSDVSEWTTRLMLARPAPSPQSKSDVSDLDRLILPKPGTPGVGGRGVGGGGS